MLNNDDRKIAKFVLTNMIELLQQEKFTRQQFDGELKSYLEYLLGRGMDVVEIRELTASVGMDIHVNVHIT